MLPLTLQTVLNDTWSKNLKMCSTWIKSLSVLNELGFRMIFDKELQASNCNISITFTDDDVTISVYGHLAILICVQYTSARA